MSLITLKSTSAPSRSLQVTQHIMEGITLKPQNMTNTRLGSMVWCPSLVSNNTQCDHTHLNEVQPEPNRIKPWDVLFDLLQKCGDYFISDLIQQMSLPNSESHLHTYTQSHPL